ncbi:hypothetical protein [Jatrophihabitans sp.]|uniref:hypothetical protein n=1 Tax=Jatrophihabitans sp. TaxID=1932789 RepID=UPI002C184321|nr:hypothetical protein [Jatrophihabitans sp.]
MIEFPPPPPPSPPAGNRRLVPMAVAAVLVLVVVVALVNGYRNRSTRQAADRIGPLSPAPSQTVPVPSVPAPRGGFGLVPLVACPQIRDEESRLTYRCIDDALRQDAPDVNLGLRISLTQEVEPGWVVSEGSGNPRSLASPPTTDTVGYLEDSRANPRPLGPSVPSPAQVQTEVRRRTDLALERGYGDNPSSEVLAAHTRSFGGVQGYELLTEITINPAYRARRHLAARVERLWTVGVPTTAGISIFMLSIPDNRKDLWPKAEATIATVQVL